MRVSLALFAFTFLPGCTRTELVQHRFLAETPSSRGEARAASQCIAACDPLWERDRSAYGACLSSCPTIEVAADASCSVAQTRSTFCFELVEEREVPDEAASRLVADIIGTAVGLAIDAALDGDGDRSHPSRLAKKVRKIRSSRLPSPASPRQPRQRL